MKVTTKIEDDVEWMRDEPFTSSDVNDYNRFSFYTCNINVEFKIAITCLKNKIDAHLERYGIDEYSDRLEIAIAYYRKALYEYFKTESRARSIAPGAYIVGPSKYEGNHAKADKMRDIANEKLRKAKHYIEKAINEQTKGKLIKGTYTSNLKRNELSGPKLKKSLALKAARKSYENKHVDGSGNFGFVLVKEQEDGSSIHYYFNGKYTSEQFVYDLQFGIYGNKLVKLNIDDYDGLIIHCRNIIFQTIAGNTEI